MSTFIRPRRDGQGCSECSSPDELVGKRRCCHVLGEENDTLTVNQIQRGMYEVEVNESKMTINAQKETIINFFKKIPEISGEKQQKILEFLEEE